MDAALPSPSADLIALISRWTSGKSDCATPIEGLSFFRREAPAAPALCFIEPSLVMVFQGEKQMLVGEDAYPYDSRHFLITTLDLPANSQVLTASAERPCLGLTLRLDLQTVAEMITQGRFKAPSLRNEDRGIGIGTMTAELLDPLGRLLRLLDEPEAIPIMASLIQREILYRLLTSEQAPRLWQVISAGGPGNRVAEAIDWLKAHFAEDLRIQQLAAHVNMSPSSLHQHFRQLTTMSPLQYQKWLRLNEARKLMISEHLDAAEAAFRVGYESPPQFTREYRRLFGAPPKRDVRALIGESR